MVFWCSHVLQAQSGYRKGAPLIKNYTPAEYRAHLQNWDIVQDKRDVLYFANTSGVLVFNGNFWDLIPCSNNSTIRSMAKSTDDIIYVGAIGDLGYLAIDASGKMFFRSLLSAVAPQYRDFNDIWRTYATSDGVFFVTSKMIFHYKNNSFSYIEGDFKPMFGCVHNDKLYMLQKPGGIYYLENDKLKLLPGTEIFNDAAGRVQLISGTGEQLFIASVNKGLYKYNVNSYFKKNNTTLLEKLNNAINADAYFKHNQLYSGCKINDNSYAWGTISGGLCITDSLGNIIEIINKQRGLLSNIVLNSYLDNRGNLWLAQPTGISQVMLSMPFSLFNKTNGLEGSINSLVLQQGAYYAATMQGLYKLKPYQFNVVNDNYSFMPVLPQTYFSWDMLSYKNEIYATGPDDILVIHNDDLKKLNFKFNMYCFGESKKFPDYLFVGLIDGMAVMEFSGDNNRSVLIKQKRLPEVNEPIRHIAQDNTGDLWITSNYQGILHLHFNSMDVNDYTITRYDTNNALPDGGNQFVYFINNNLYAATPKGLYRKTKNSEKFVKINWNRNPLFHGNTEFIQLVNDNKNRMWFNTGKGIFYVDKSDTMLQVVSTPFKMVNFDFKEIHFNDGIWFGTSAGLYFYDETINKNFYQDFNALIYKIVGSNDSVVFYGNYYEAQGKKDTFSLVSLQQPSELKNSFQYSENCFTFFFASPYYESDEKPLFSYILEGYDKSWSQWSSETKKEYTNLHEGNYVFKVKAKNIFGKESAICTYAFEIEPPWYRTYWAFVSYVISFLVIFIGGLYLNSQRLVRKNIKLERMVNERTAQIMQQKEEIQAQAELLEQSNKELEQLSVVASKTDNIVIIAAPDGTIEWVNDTFTKTYGYSLDEFRKKRGKNITEVTSNPDIHQVINNALAEKKSVEYVSKTENKKGDFIWFYTTLTPIIDIKNELVKIILIDSDITKIKTAEQEILIQNEEIGIQNKNMKTLIQELEAQKELLQSQNEYIQGSIRYAFTIQQSILPEQKSINRYFDNFILFLPKDIVSGDFYWFSDALSFQNKLAFAMVDCTGHGVPGAFMSLIGNRLLNEIVNEKRITDPKQVLTLMDTKIIEVLNQSQSDNFDGMDMSFCVLENMNSNAQKLIYSGAQQPICIYKAKEKELRVIAADKRSLGGLESKKNIAFTNKEVMLQKGDIIYLMSDGWADQNNEGKKRYCSSRIIALLKEVAELPLEAQKLAIAQSIKEWKGQTPQRDDITVLGLKA